MLEACSSVLSSKPRETLDFWLAGVERIAKSSLLGHLLLPLVTAMTHYNLRCLHIADHIMAQLAQLIIVTSQVRGRTAGVLAGVAMFYTCTRRCVVELIPR